MDKKTALKEIMETFEKGKVNVPLTLSAIHKLTGKEITEAEIREYWTYTSLEEFCNELLTEPIANWEQIDDESALLLIKEILANITNDSIVNRNSEALTKRYAKSPGFISELIFHQDITDELALLKLLKKDTAIYL